MTKRFSLSALLAALTACPSPTLAQNMDIVTSPAFVAGYDDFYRSFDWDHANSNLAFKFLHVGQVVDLSDHTLLAVRRKKTTSMGIDVGQNFNTNAPFDCPIGLIINCELRLWPDKRYSSAVMDLQTAFGEQAQVYLFVIPQLPYFLNRPDAPNLGTGRIVLIKIAKRQPSDAFLQAAYQHFSQVMSSIPAVTISGGGPHSGYSDPCKSAIRLIALKPPASRSPTENSTLDTCNLQLLQSNDSTTTATKLLSWRDATGKSAAEISLQNNGVLRTVEITFGFDIRPALAKLTGVVNGVSAGAAQERNQKNAKDF